MALNAQDSPPAEAPPTMCEKKAHDMALDKQENLIYGSLQMITVHRPRDASDDRGDALSNVKRTFLCRSVQKLK